MAKRQTVRRLYAPVESGMERAIGAIDDRKRQLAELAADPPFQRSEYDRQEAAIIGDSRRTFADLGDALTKAIDSVKARASARSKLSVQEIEAGWRADRELLDAGLGIDDVLRSPGFSRAMAEGLLTHFGAYVFATTKNEAVARQAAERAEALVMEAMLPLVTGSDRDAVEAYLDLRASNAAVEALADFMASDGGTLAQLTFGHRLAEVGFEGEDAEVALDRQDPERAARRARNSMPPELRAQLDDNARSIGFVKAPAEPSLQLRS